jgi:AbrB family looped-hinge helix DNA binding protein
MRHEAKVTSKGQLTVPAALRKALNLKPGDKVVFVQDAGGHVAIEARTKTLAGLRGVVRLRGRAPINDWVEEARAARADDAVASRTQPPTKQKPQKK